MAFGAGLPAATGGTAPQQEARIFTLTGMLPFRIQELPINTQVFMETIDLNGTLRHPLHQFTTSANLNRRSSVLLTMMRVHRLKPAAANYAIPTIRSVSTALI